MELFQRPIICIIATDTGSQPQRVLLQRRVKSRDDTPYSGYFELPQGKVNHNESLEGAARRELSEETGLDLGPLLAGGESPYDAGSWKTSNLLTSHPLICVADTIQNHLGIAVVAEVQGTPYATSEAAQHRWCTFTEVTNLVNRRAIFPLNIPMLQEFMRVALRAMEAK
ncbi:NUDIX hydrolase [Micromonospora ureilytica]|uniref:NUDIX hydrolase n=1 Tax=Micromonospora ureilytica TaxID=709868 RepID=UPI00142E6653|nr:NUDIX hydrolase [Micromonospora ureilytica]